MHSPHRPKLSLADRGPLQQYYQGGPNDATADDFPAGRHRERELTSNSLVGVDDLTQAARLVRGHGERSDPMALAIFEQQAMALGRLFTIAANYSDPDAYFLGGGVVEAKTEFREWFLSRVRTHTLLRDEQARVAQFALVPDLDMAGARGSALAARASLR